MTGTKCVQTRTVFSLMVLIVASSMVARAQEGGSNTANMRLGIIAGANWNFVPIAAGDFIEAPEGSTLRVCRFDGSSSYGHFFGVQGDYDLLPILGVHARLTYDERFIANRDAGGSTLEARLAYLSLEPAIRITNSAATRIFLMAGPSFHFNVVHRYDFTPSDKNDTPIHDAEIEYVNPVILGVWTNIGIDIPLAVDVSGIGWYVSPVFEASYLFNQVSYEEDEHDVAAADEYHQWTTVTFRAGIGVKYSFEWRVRP